MGWDDWLQYAEGTSSAEERGAEGAENTVDKPTMLHGSCRGKFRPSLYILESVMFCVNKGNLGLVGETSAYATRNADDFSLPRLRLKGSEAYVEYAGAGFFNRLPKDLKRYRNTRQLRHKLTDYLVERSL